MSVRLATLHVAKENFAGHKLSREVRQSQALQRQKDKRLVAMSQRRGNVLEEVQDIVQEEAKSKFSLPLCGDINFDLIIARSFPNRASAKT